jgi:hypothetical protein
MTHGGEMYVLDKENIAQRLSVFVQSPSPDWTKEKNDSVISVFSSDLSGVARQSEDGSGW